MKTKLGPGRRWGTSTLRNCPFCKNKKLRIVKEKMPLDGVEYEAIHCMSCGERVMTMGQLGELADKYRRLRKAKEVTFAQWGNSLAVRIPRKVAEKYKLSSGKQGLLLAEKEGIRIIPQA